MTNVKVSGTEKEAALIRNIVINRQQHFCKSDDGII